MANRPEVHGNHIEIIMEGDQDANTIRDLIKQNDAAIGRFVASGRPLQLLVDLSAVGRVTPSAVTAGIQTSKHHTYQFQKMAIFGINRTILREIVAGIVKIFNDEGSVQIVANRAEAITWLEGAAAELKPSEA